MTDIHRRQFLTATLAALGVGPTGLAARLGATQRGAAAVPSGTSGTRRVDMHHHFAPPAWVTAVRGRPLLQPANLTWTVEKSIDDMDRGGVAAAVVSITNPGVHFGDAVTARQLARACNEYGARLVRDHPTRFGLFAVMPLPDVDGTLAEIAYAYDTLKTDGIGLQTSYGDMWLGHPTLKPVMEDLNRRRAIVHVHPTAANCCRNLDYAPGVQANSLEYGVDTTRAMMGIAFSGDAVRYPNIRFIWSHGGGVAPFLAGRIENAARNAADRLPRGFTAEIRKYHYDLAGAANKGAVASLLQLVPPSQILFGTDFPPGGTSLDIAKTLSELGLFSAADLGAIERDNAVALLPRLK